MPPARPPGTPASVLELCGVSKVYGEGPAQVQALRGISMSVAAGALVAVMGPSGSGKSTLLTIAGSLEEPTSGEVFIGGAPVSGMSRNAKARLRRRSIGYVFQDFNLLGQAAQAAPAGPNLPANQLIVYLSPGGLGELIPRQSAAGLRGLTGRVEALAASLHAQDVLALESAVKPAASAGPRGRGNRPGGQEPAGLLKTIPSCPSPGAEYAGQVYVATPALLRHYGIKPGEINPTADLLTSRTGLAAVQLASGAVQGCGYNSDVQYARHPPVQAVSLPTDTSDPNALLTTHALTTLRWRAIPAGWLIQTARPLTAAQLGAARQLASAAGVTVETRAAQDSPSRLRDWATGAGLLLALGVLAMTAGRRSQGP